MPIETKKKRLGDEKSEGIATRIALAGQPADVDMLIKELWRLYARQRTRISGRCTGASKGAGDTFPALPDCTPVDEPFGLDPTVQAAASVLSATPNASVLLNIAASIHAVF